MKLCRKSLSALVFTLTSRINIVDVQTFTNNWEERTIITNHGYLWTPSEV